MRIPSLKVETITSSLLLLTLFIGSSIYTYRLGWVAIPMGDHGTVMQERSFYSGEREFLLGMISYNQTRRLAQGDRLLFRPLTSLTHAVLDIWARHDLVLIGLTSVILHGCVGFLLFLILKSQIGSAFSLAVAGTFLVLFSGSLMVIWRHISPYMGSLIFYALAIRLLLNTTQTTATRLLTSIFLTISSLFHEATALSLLIGYFFPMRNGEAPERFWKMKRLWFVVLPLLFFISLYVVDHARHSTGSFSYRQDILASGPVQKPFKSLGRVLYTAGFLFSTSLVPSLLHVEAPNFVVRLASALSLSSLVTPIMIGGGVLLVFLVWVFFYTSSKNHLLWHPSKSVAYRLCFAYFLAIIVGVGLGRTSLRGEQYLFTITYYNYMFIFIGLVFAGFTLSSIMRIVSTQRVYIVAITVLCVIYGSYHYRYLRTYLNGFGREERIFATFVSDAAKLLGVARSTCYAGHNISEVINPHVANLVESYTATLLFRFSCTERKSEAVNVIMDKNGRAFLRPLDTSGFLSQLHRF